MIPYPEAAALIRKQGVSFPVKAEEVLLDEACGRICACDIVSPRANQPFDNSAMDGFAVISEDLSGAVNDNPVVLDMAGHLAAGGPVASGILVRGQCYEIMTGAPVPKGADAVVPVEKIVKDTGGHITFRAPVRSGENIRITGADFSTGDLVVGKGTVLNPGHILALATLGVGHVHVLRKLKIGLISTGLEVVDDIRTDLKEGQIFNSTAPYLRSILPLMGVEILSLGTVSDDIAAFRAKIHEAEDKGCDVILSTGAVSAGVHDFVPSVIKSVGAEVFFHKVSIRPGKPVFFARLPEGGPFYIGLPGNPVSTAAGLRFFVQPLLRAMQGLPPEQPSYAVVSEDYTKLKEGLCFFLRGKAGTDAQGRALVHIIKEQQSFMVKPFTVSDVWLCVPENTGALKAGDVVEVYQ